MANLEELQLNLEKARNHQRHAYEFLASSALAIDHEQFPPHVTRQLVTLMQQSLQLFEQLRIMHDALPTFQQPPRTDL